MIIYNVIQKVPLCICCKMNDTVNFSLISTRGNGWIIYYNGCDIMF